MSDDVWLMHLINDLNFDNDLDEGVMVSTDKRYAIYAATDTVRHGQSTLSGFPFKCRLYGRDDQWRPENERVFVCEHEPVDAMLLPIAQKDTVRTELIGRVDEM